MGNITNIHALMLIKGDTNETLAELLNVSKQSITNKKNKRHQWKSEEKDILVERWGLEDYNYKELKEFFG